MTPLLCRFISSPPSELNVWWRLIPSFSSFKSTHPSAVILKERIPQGANLSNNRETSTTSKQTQKQQQRPRAQSSLSLNFHTCERRTWQGHLWIGGNATCLSSINSAACLSPSFFQHCLSFLCGAEMLKLHFSDVGSLEVCARRQVSAGKSGKKREGERKRHWKKDKGKRKKRQKEKRRARAGRDLPLTLPSWIYAEMLHLPYMLFSNVNACWQTWISQQYGTCGLIPRKLFTISSLAKDDKLFRTPVSNIQVTEVYNKHAFLFIPSSLRCDAPTGKLPLKGMKCSAASPR